MTEQVAILWIQPSFSRDKGVYSYELGGMIKPMSIEELAQVDSNMMVSFWGGINIGTSYTNKMQFVYEKTSEEWTLYDSKALISIADKFLAKYSLADYFIILKYRTGGFRDPLLFEQNLSKEFFMKAARIIERDKA